MPRFLAAAPHHEATAGVLEHIARIWPLRLEARTTRRFDIGYAWEAEVTEVLIICNARVPMNMLVKTSGNLYM